MVQNPEHELEAELEQAQYELEAEAQGMLPEQEMLPEEEFQSTYEAEPEIIGPDTRVRVTNTTVAPFRYICNLEYNDPRFGVVAMCTGTLIGPSTVLTAGHCLSRRVASRMRVIAGRNGSLEPLPATGAAALRQATAFVQNSPTDYGVVQLRHPIGIRIGYWSVGHRLGHGDPIGTSISAAPLPLNAGKLRVNLSGYPADKPSGARFVCTLPTRPKNRCFNSFGDPRRSRVCGTEQWRAYDRTVASRGGILEYLDDTCPGHSGSPVWVRRDASRGGRVMIGIHIARDQPPSPVANRSVRISRPILNNIVRWLADAPVPPPFRVLDRFNINSQALAPAHTPLIAETARAILARLSTPRRVRAVYLVGHTDTRGTAAYNLNLSRQRAVAVRTALIAALNDLRPGLSGPLRFVIESLGETQPTATNSTPDGQARNRRVEVLLARI